MDLAEFYPDPEVLIASEVEVLGFLRNSVYVKERQNDFALVAERCYRRYEHDRRGFEFASHLSVHHSEMFGRRPAKSERTHPAPNLQLIVAAGIQLANGALSNISYCLAVCRIRANHPSILRKFHFDATTSVTGQSTKRQPHPATHLQYCGEMLPSMLELGCRVAQLNQMHKRLSEPRILALRVF
jgi:hypothetical protein